MCSFGMTGNGPRSRHDQQVASGIGRRTYLQLGTGLAAAGVCGRLATGRARASSGTLADPAPTDREVGGGATYDRIVDRSDATYLVGTADELLNALDAAGAGDVVYVEDDATISLDGVSDINVGNRVTVASGRGSGTSGALLYTTEYPSSLFKVWGDRVRFTGLRIQGPRWDYFTTDDHDRYAATGVWLLGEDGEVDNCQFYGWPHAGVAVGARSYTPSAYVHHCSIHNNQLEGLGYGVNLYNGHSVIEYTYFDHNRHSICGFGHETNGFEARYNLVGPNPVSHAFDMHCLLENGGDTNRAGGTIDIHHNTFQFTHDKHDRAQEAIAIRGIPADGAWIKQNSFAHQDKPDGVDVEAHGQAYRQGNLDEDRWQNIWASGNVFGDADLPSDVGCPRPRQWRTASAVSAVDGPERASVSLSYANPFERSMMITDVGIDPRSSAISTLADGTKDEGRWASEIHTQADIQNGCTDVGGGVALPGAIDLDSDGHADSPDTQPVLSAGSSASMALTQFLDDGGNPVDMNGEDVDLIVAYKLGDGTTGADRFSITPTATGGLAYAGDATAVAPHGGSKRGGLEFSVFNGFAQQLLVTDIRIAPESGRVARLSDPSLEVGRWASEIHARADRQNGCTDVGGGVNLPSAVDLDRAGHSASPDTQPLLSAGSTASFAFWQFCRQNDKPIDMAGRAVEIELAYKLEDGTTDSVTFTVNPSG